MTQFHHPMRDLDIHVFANLSKADSFIARFYPYDAAPVFYHGTTADDARDKAEAARQDAIAKHEANSIARQEALAKARETRAKKGAAA